MSDNKDNLKDALSAAFTASLIRFSAIGFIVFVCSWVFLPFLPILLWALVLAIALYPVRKFFEAKFGWTPARASTIIAISGVLLLGVPTVMVGNSFATKTFHAYQDFQDGKLEVPAPTETVKEWPLIGEKLYVAWDNAAKDFPEFAQANQMQIQKMANGFMDAAGGAASTVFLLIGAIIIAGIMLAWSKHASKSIERIFITFTDSVRGPSLQQLTTATIRQVAVGIIGIAFLTAMIFGAVVALSGLPAAALFTLIALLLAIIQLPVTLIALVAVALLWSMDGNTSMHNTIFSVLLIAASLVDNFLKPLILGRGLAVPMPIVLIGAIGGMMSGGILGMFIGAAFLSAGYQVFMEWVDSEVSEAESKEVSSE